MLKLAAFNFTSIITIMKQYNFPHLEEEYQQYLSVIESCAADETINVEWYPLVAQDMKKKAIDGLSHDASQREMDTALNKAKYTVVNLRDHEFIIRGFSKNILQLFVGVEQGDEYDEDLQQKLSFYKTIPKERRKGALTHYNGGYYWGGQFIRTEDDGTI